MPAAKPSAAQEWRAGWTVVLASFVGYSYLSLTAGSLSMFIEPIGDEFGWGRTLITSGFSVASVFTALLSPFMGLMVDRYGARRIALPGIMATSLAIASFSLANGSAAQWYMLWVAYAVISISVKATIWTSAVAGLFDKGQGLALGITLGGTAAAGAILPPLVDFLINEYGWRMAYIWLAFGWGAVTLLLAWLFLYDAHDRHAAAARLDKSKAEKAATKRERPEFPGLTIAEAWQDPALRRIAISSGLIMMLTVGLSIHQIPILTEAGVSRTNAAWLAGLAGLAALVGKLLTGVLLDRFRPNWVGGLTLAASALAFALLIDGVHSPVLIVFAMLVNGYTQGTKVQIVSYLTARYAGMRNFGTIFGFMNSVLAAGSGAGPIVAGLIFDFTGSYGWFLIAGSVASVLCGMLLFSLPAYPAFKPIGSPGQVEA